MWSPLSYYPGFLSDHQSLPDGGGCVGAGEVFEDLQAEVDGTAGSTAGDYTAVRDCRSFDIFGALGNKIFLEAVVAGEAYSIKVIKLRNNQAWSCADSSHGAAH